MKRLRLILGDQLNGNHSWYQEVSKDVVYVMAELRQETDYVRHHIQKVIAFFAAMRSFALELQERGHQVQYYTLSDPKNPGNLPDLIQLELGRTGATQFEYQLPDEFRLDRQLKEISEHLSVTTIPVDTEHFYTQRDTLKDFFTGKKQLLMESFYRMMRQNTVY